MSSADRRRHVRGYLVGLVVLVAGGALCLAASGLTWAEVQLEGRLATQHVTVSGRDLLSLAPAAGWLALAAVVATYATRRIGRKAVGVVLIAFGGSVAALATRLVLDLSDRTAAWVERNPELDGAVVGVDTAAGPVVLTMVGGALIALAGVLTVWRGLRWPAMGQRYERPAGGERRAGRERPTDGQPSQRSGSRAAWDALDRGEDPTA